MNILLFGGHGFNSVGGTEEFTRSFSKELAKKHGVSVLCHQLRSKKERRNDNVKVYYVPKTLKFKYFPPAYLLRSLVIFLKALQIVKRDNISFVLVREPESIALIPLRLFGVKVLVRGCVFYKNKKIEIDSKFSNKFVRIILKRISKVYQNVVVNLSSGLVAPTLKEIRDFRKISNRKILHLPYAIDGSIFYPSNKKNKSVLIYTGFLRPVKKIDLLIKLFDKIRETCNLELYLVGALKTPYTKENLLAKSKNKNKIKFLGEKSREETASLLRHSGIFVQTAIDFGNSPTEAAASGIPVVALGNFEKDLGIVVDKEEAFINSIIKLAKDKENYEIEAKKALAYVGKNRTYGKAADNFIKFLRRLN